MIHGKKSAANDFADAMEPILTGAIMDDTIEKPPAPAKPPAPKPDQDLSRDIERMIGKEPHDRVKCVRVYGDRYRCNWWAPPVDKISSPAFNWAFVTTHQVRKSRFLNASMSSGQLVVEEVGIK